jgi:molybdopterin synthase catalytic subunit/molybdopterin converting factor small subunit
VEVRIRLFAMQRQQLGWRDRPLGLPDGSTVADAWAALVASHAELAAASGSIRFARNGAYVDTSVELADGDELALIPPVAGGSTEGYRRIELWPAPFPDELLAELRQAVSSTADGAVVVFLGQTRESPGTPAAGQEDVAAELAGKRVEALAYEAFESMAISILGDIAGEIEARFGVRRLAILHRTGDVPLGDASVCIVVAAEHRGSAFDACRYAIDELKARAPIWKQERFIDGEVWIGEPPRAGPG